MTVGGYLNLGAQDEAVPDLDELYGESAAWIAFHGGYGPVPGGYGAQSRGRRRR
jgi:hypothetical protein